MQRESQLFRCRLSQGKKEGEACSQGLGLFVRVPPLHTVSPMLREGADLGALPYLVRWANSTFRQATADLEFLPRLLLEE